MSASPSHSYFMHRRFYRQHQVEDIFYGDARLYQPEYPANISYFDILPTDKSGGFLLQTKLRDDSSDSSRLTTSRRQVDVPT
ncbi:MAG: hypothetical protein ACPG7F_09165 [Aggregatilineales bacterium]